MDLAGTLRAVGPPLSPDALQRLTAQWRMGWFPKGRALVAQGDVTAEEYLILDGRAVSLIGDPEGRCVCVGFYDAPAVVTPHVARAHAGQSLVTLTVTADATVATLDAAALTQMMVADGQIRDWGNAVLRDALAQKTAREWCLAALAGRARLQWFRETYPGAEARFAHGHIASFLGMTPVSLSRLRNPG